jgi:manganese/iron transport system permease protein
MLIDPYWFPVLAGGLITGASSGMLGVYIVGMRMPFLGVCVAHSALAGAVFGSLFGLTGQALLLPALAGATVTALLLGLLTPERIQADTNVVLGILFTLTMGLAFLGLGLFSTFGRSDNEARALLWGSLTFCRWKDVRLMLITAAALAGFILIFFKEMRAIMFSRTHAAAAGVRVTLVWTIFLILTSMVLTVNFQTVGGLMIYSLVANPAAAAFQLAKSQHTVLVTSISIGACTCLIGFLFSLATDLPTGAVIVILSSLIVAVAAAWRYWQRNRGGAQL